MSTKWVTIAGGLEIQVFQIGRELARRGHRIDLLFSRDGELRPEYESFCRSTTQVPPFLFSRKRALRDLAHLGTSVRVAARARPELVYVNHPDELVFGLLSGLVARAPVVCHLHGSEPTPMLPRLAARAHRLIACSEFVQNLFVDSGVDASRITVVHNGIELDDYPPADDAQRAAARVELGLPEDAFVVLYFGRLEAEKGPEVLLNAWRRLGLSPDEARLVIMGSAPLHPDPERRLSELHAMAPPGCHWLPARRNVIMPLHAADVVAVPSIWDEPFGRVVVEGLAAGLPVVASRVGGIPEILDGDLAPLLFERGSDVELAERLDSLINWRRDRPALGKQCAAHAAKYFSIDKMIDGIERVFDEAVS